MGGGLGLCYHARPSYQEAQVSSNSCLLFVSLTELLHCSRDLGLSERGFGFVTFKDPSAVQSVVTQGPHILDNKTVSLSLLILDGHRCQCLFTGHLSVLCRLTQNQPLRNQLPNRYVQTFV